jgi:hypothetical protein
MFHNRLFSNTVAALAVIASLASPALSVAATPSNAAARIQSQSQARAASIASARRNSSFTPAATRQLAARKTIPIATKSMTGPSGWGSPYDRFMKPTTQRLLAKARAAGMSATLQPHAAASGGSNLSVNFPGFLETTAVQGNNPSDVNVTWVSLTADVNKDGKPDVITVQNDGSVNVLLNPGTGKFSDFAVSSTNTTAMQYGVAFVYGTAVDLNQDGYPDLELLDVVNNQIFVYMNKKDGTFSDPVATTVAFSNGTTFYSNGGSALFFDVNGDKIPDMVTTIPFASFDDSGNPQTTFTIQTSLGKGDGTFAAPGAEQLSSIAAYLYSNYGQVVSADINKDGKQDLVYLTGGSDASGDNLGYAFPVLGNGDGAFGAVPSVLPTTGAIVIGPYVQGYGSLAVSDMNGDGNPDILFSLGDGNLYTALGTGTANPQNVQIAATDLSAPIVAGPDIVSFADVNGDGIVDAISYNFGFIAVYTGTKTGLFQATPLVQLASGDGGDEQPTPADFNGDGRVDLVQVDYAVASIGFYPGGDWTHAGAQAMAVPTESAQTFQVMAQGDFNGDGIPDILAADFNGVPIFDQFGGFAKPNAAPSVELGVDGTFPNLKVGINDGKGNFTYTTALASSVSFGIAVNWVEPIAADLNGDGKADIILGANQGVAIALNNGDGTFAAPVTISLGAPTQCTISYVDVGDLNRDGYPDIVAAYPGDASCGYPYNTPPTQSGVFILINDKKGGFTSTFLEYGYGAYLPKLADLNGDSNLDLLIADTGAGSLGYYLYAIPGNGDGTFNIAGATEPLESTVVTSIIPGDFDGDGKIDLALGVETQVDADGNPVYNTTGLNILKGNGDFTFGLPIQYAPGVYPVDGKIADFNGDGRPDLALNMLGFDYYTNIQTSSFVYLPNLGGGGFGAPVTAFAPTNAPGNVFTADFNGDGAIDAISSGLDEDLSGVTGIYWNLGAISLKLTASATTVQQGTSVTVTASLTPGLSTATPTGTITFYNNGAILGIIPVSGDTATYTLNGDTASTYSITAVYSGDSNFNAAKSSALAVAITTLAPAITLQSPTPAAISLVQGYTGTATMTIVANATFAGVVTFACSGAPSEASCTVSPSSIILSGNQSATVTMVITTTSPNNVSVASNRPPANPFTTLLGASGGVSVAGLAVFFLGSRQRKRYLRACGLVILFAVALIAATGLTGCGSSYKYAGTTVGTSKITVTATSGTLIQTNTISLTVTK